MTVGVHEAMAAERPRRDPDGALLRFGRGAQFLNSLMSGLEPQPQKPVGSAGNWRSR